MKAANNKEEFQKIEMCVKTYFNLYGVMPGISDMVKWLGASYEPLLYSYISSSVAA